MILTVEMSLAHSTEMTQFLRVLPPEFPTRLSETPKSSLSMNWNSEIEAVVTALTTFITGVGEQNFKVLKGFAGLSALAGCPTSRRRPGVGGGAIRPFSQGVATLGSSRR